MKEKKNILGLALLTVLVVGFLWSGYRAEASNCGALDERFIARCQDGRCEPLFLMLQELGVQCARLPYVVEWDLENPADPLWKAPDEDYVRNTFLVDLPGQPADRLQALFDLGFERNQDGRTDGLFELRTDSLTRDAAMALLSSGQTPNSNLWPEVVRLSERADSDIAAWWRGRMKLAARQERFLYWWGRMTPVVVGVCVTALLMVGVSLGRKSRQLRQLTQALLRRS